MYQIGAFSKLTNTSIRTLRYYNDIGLLIPEEIDVYTNYRYYGKNNIKDLNTINELKEAGFTLYEIKENWHNITEEVLMKKRKELYQKVKNINSEIKNLDDIRSKLSGTNNKTKKL